MQVVSFLPPNFVCAEVALQFIQTRAIPAQNTRPIILHPRIFSVAHNLQTEIRRRTRADRDRRYGGSNDLKNMNATVRKRFLNEDFKRSQPLPALTAGITAGDPKDRSSSAGKARSEAKQSRRAEKPSPFTRRSLVRFLALDASCCLLVAAWLVAPKFNEGGATSPALMIPATAVWTVPPPHEDHAPWNAFPAHHLPGPPAIPLIHI